MMDLETLKKINKKAEERELREKKEQILKLTQELERLEVVI